MDRGLINVILFHQYLFNAGALHEHEWELDMSPGIATEDRLRPTIPLYFIDSAKYRQAKRQYVADLRATLPGAAAPATKPPSEADRGPGSP